MRNEKSERFGTAVLYLIKIGLAKSQAEIARKIGTTSPALSMAISGERIPQAETMLKLCEFYPINFWWLYYGVGVMIKEDAALLMKKIEELESGTCLKGRG